MVCLTDGIHIQLAWSNSVDFSAWWSYQYRQKTNDYLDSLSTMHKIDFVINNKQKIDFTRKVCLTDDIHIELAN